MSATVREDEPGALGAARDVLLAGGLVVLPTDTVYGLAARPDRRGAMARLFAAKGRPGDVPVAVLVADLDQARALVDEVPARAERWAGDWWPGPLTLVLPRRAGPVLELGSSGDTVGVRCPDRDFVRRLAAEVGPIATTSANRHGEPTPTEAGVVGAQLGEVVDLVIDGGSCDGVASTVVDLVSAPGRVLRRGGLDPGCLGLG